MSGRTIWTAVICVFALWHLPHANAYPPSAENNKIVTAKFAEARRLFVDSLPEDGNRLENLLVDCIRIDPDNAELFALLARVIVWQVANSLKDPAEMHQALDLAVQAKDLAPERPLGDLAIAEIYLAMGQKVYGEGIYRSLKEKFPRHVDVLAFEARYFAGTDPSLSLAASQAALALGHPMDDLSLSIV